MTCCILFTSMKNVLKPIIIYILIRKKRSVTRDYKSENVDSKLTIHILDFSNEFILSSNVVQNKWGSLKKKFVSLLTIIVLFFN